MTDYSIPEIEEKLREVRDRIAGLIQTLPDERFFTGSAQDWSAADYVKHLILGIKPFAKGLGLPRERLQAMFERPDRPSRSYEDLVAAYEDVLAAGGRAELVPTVMPTGYRMPEGIAGGADESAYLLDTWQDSNERVFTALRGWTDDDIDAYQMPHPAVGMATLREWLYFMHFHNQLHAGDIARKGQ
ncbi:MAG: DinB family protein [Chloroflexi bacterium]|nr:DinB family protein [Chloroflexota bacterium]